MKERKGEREKEILKVKSKSDLKRKEKAIFIGKERGGHLWKRK